MPNYSSGTNIVWRIAAVEAQNLRHQEIDPVDLMLGILKLVDVEIGKIAGRKKDDSIGDINSEVNEIKSIFLESGLVAVKTRRRLRRESVHQLQNTDYKSGVIHRSPRLKDVFRRAETFLSSTEKIIKPIHLLAALLDKKESEFKRLLMLVNFPVSSLEANLGKKLTSNSEGGIQPTLPSDTTHSGTEELIRHCRAAIGYLELNMKDEALSELNQIPDTEKNHVMVKKLLQEINKNVI